MPRARWLMNFPPGRPIPARAWRRSGAGAGQMPCILRTVSRQPRPGCGRWKGERSIVLSIVYEKRMGHTVSLPHGVCRCWKKTVPFVNGSEPARISPNAGRPKRRSRNTRRPLKARSMSGHLSCRMQLWSSRNSLTPLSSQTNPLS